MKRLRNQFVALIFTWVAPPFMTPALRTERVLLTPCRPEDEEDFVSVFLDTRVSRWMG
ncbi:hypothetical protein Atai01_10340 [Amycolatopsis taiwanensis]|uniref:Uncharacterized protein n=1 Tax=Amycolatopsis taiwanensis TaxID=342230 RepID=A0A9W6VD47_9PSEU|nr:hypothetical protein Atai01_10340 [Amycolatopsis taiwanensis]